MFHLLLNELSLNQKKKIHKDMPLLLVGLPRARI